MKSENISNATLDALRGAWYNEAMGARTDRPVMISAETHAALRAHWRKDGVKMGHAADQAVRMYLVSRGISSAEIYAPSVAPKRKKRRR